MNASGEPDNSRDLLNEWGLAGQFEVSDSSCKSRAYRLPETYRQFVGSLSAR